MIGELLGQAREDPDPGFDLGEQQPASVGADLSPIEFSHHRPLAQGVKFQLLAATLCHRKAVLLLVHN